MLSSAAHGFEFPTRDCGELIGNSNPPHWLAASQVLCRACGVDVTAQFTFGGPMRCDEEPDELAYEPVRLRRGAAVNPRQGDLALRRPEHITADTEFNGPPLEGTGDFDAL